MLQINSIPNKYFSITYQSNIENNEINILV